MEERKSWIKNVIVILLISIVILIGSFGIGKIIEPKLQIKHGRIIDFESEIIYRVDGTTDRDIIYQIKDNETGEISNVREDKILLPYNLLLGILPIKNVTYSTYKNAVAYNIALGGQFVGIVGVLVSGLCFVRNPYKKKEM